jgi:hypothetical protein
VKKSKGKEQKRRKIKDGRGKKIGNKARNKEKEYLCAQYSYFGIGMYVVLLVV